MLDRFKDFLIFLLTTSFLPQSYCLIFAPVSVKKKSPLSPPMPAAWNAHARLQNGWAPLWQLLTNVEHVQKKTESLRKRTLMSRKCVSLVKSKEKLLSS